MTRAERFAACVLLAGCAAPSAPPSPTQPPSPSACADDGVTVQAVQSTPGPAPGQLNIVAELSAAAPLTVRCTDAAGTEEHVITSPAAPTHEVRLSGLVAPDTTCAVSPSCSESSAWPIDLPPVTSPLPQLEVVVDATLGMTGHYTLAAFVDGPCDDTATKWLGIWGADGTPRWWQPLPDDLDWIDVEALWHDDIQALVWGGGESPAGRVRAVDVWEGPQVVASPEGWEGIEFHHDGKRLPDGRLLTLEERWNTDADATTRWKGFGARLLAADGSTPRLDIDSQRYVDEGLLPAGDFDLDRDPYHANWVEWVEEADGGTLFVSACQRQELLAIDGTTGALRWVWGAGLGWAVQEADGTPMGDEALPQCLHGAETDGTRFVVYDNGRQRGASSVAVWEVDPTERVATRVWSWSEPGWFEETLGDVDELANGRVLVTQAHPECWSSNPGARSQIVEVDPTSGHVASRLIFPSVDHAIYRSQRYDGCELFPSLVQYCSQP